MMSELGGCIIAVANVVLLQSQVGEGLDDPANDTLVFRKNQYNSIRRDLAELERVASELNLDATLHYVRYSLELFSRGLVGHHGELMLPRNHSERLASCLESIRTSFLVQMNSKLVLVFDSKHLEYIRPNGPLFGYEVEDAFPKASEEITEAAMCLAFHRPTAAVFHLMRAMELAVQRLAEALGKAKPTEKVWGVILADIHKAIEEMPKGPARDAWSASHTHLYHVKQAWRNDTMHPKTTYTEEQAQDVFDAVRSFMAHLAPLVR